MVNEENYPHSSSSSSSGDQYSEIPSPPEPQRKAGGWRSIKFILGNESFEKLASMSLIANITVYLSTKYNMSGIFLVTVVNVWSGFSNISSLAGAFVSDAYLGKFLTLFFGSIASLLGMGIMTLTAGIKLLRPLPCNQLSDAECSHAPEPWQLGILFTGLGLLCVGAGGIRPCNIAFGADQFDTRTPKGKAQLESFFNWWYFTFTIALVIALTGVVYVQTNVSWTLGFAIPTACLALSIAIFLLGRRTYVKVRPRGSVFSDILKVVAAAWRKRHVRLAAAGVGLGREILLYDPPLLAGQVKIPRTERFRFLDKAAAITNPAEELTELGLAKDGWRLCSVQQVEQLKCLIAVLPVGVSGVGALMTMDQNNTFGILQALQMRREFGTGRRRFTFPPGWMSIASMVALSAWIYAYERLYVPRAQAAASAGPRDRRRLSMRQRIRTGIAMSILAMLVAGSVERRRRSAALERSSFVSPESVAWLFPQFIFSGLTEAFAAVAVMEFLTMQLAEDLRTVAGAMFFLCLSVASYAGSVIVNVTHLVTKRTAKSPWLGGHDLNKNKLDYYYFFLAALAGLNLVYFSFFATHFVLNTESSATPPESSDQDQRRSDDHHGHDLGVLRD